MRSSDVKGVQELTAKGHQPSERTGLATDITTTIGKVKIELPVYGGGGKVSSSGEANELPAEREEKEPAELDGTPRDGLPPAPMAVVPAMATEKAARVSSGPGRRWRWCGCNCCRNLCVWGS